MMKKKVVLTCVLMAASTFAGAINNVINQGEIEHQCVVDNYGNCIQHGDKNYVTMDVNINNARQVCVVDNQSKCYQGPDGTKYNWCDSGGCGNN